MEINLHSKQDLDKEVENFSKSLNKFGAEFKRPLNSLHRTESRPLTRCSSKEILYKIEKHNKNPTKRVPVHGTFTSELRERLRKSLSFNDLHTLTEPPELTEFRKENKTLELLSFKGESNYFKDRTKLSNYFLENSKSEGVEIPKIVVDSPPSTEKSGNGKKSQQKRPKNEEYKLPFKLFDLDTSRKEKSVKHSTPSPIHPVARPNLAATLRAENSKKKVQELKTNCTFNDTTTQFDWEVRKTPAWKTLSLNETHKQILQLRLSTRKAEQALQQREYELNMELMRQRVKSAPLLLEGPTHWTPHIGKPSHSCPKEGRRHICQHTRRRKTLSRNQNCRRRLCNTSILEEENFGNSTNSLRVQPDSSGDITQKLKLLHKIYGSSRNIAKSQSRHSDRSTNTERSSKCQKRIKSQNVQENEKTTSKTRADLEAAETDSGDELSSLDRAFL